MITADDEVYKHYFRMPELKQSVVNNVVGQWQLKAKDVRWYQGTTL